MRKTLAAAPKQTRALISVDRGSALPPIRTSQVLREILTKNPTVKNFTVREILDTIGASRVGTSLMFFSIPGILPVPGTSNLSGIPAGLIAAHMIAGKTEIKLPRFILRRSVPRRSLIVAIYAILPVLEMTEKATRPRQQWISHPAALRILGIFIFFMALVVAIPTLGLKVPHAVSIFIISLGLAERDGLAILIGVILGLASLALLTGANVSVLRFTAVDWVKNLIRKIGFKWAAKAGLKWVARLLKKRGYQWTTLLLLEWAELLLSWDPEQSSRRVAARKRSSTLRRGRKLVRPSGRRAPSQGVARSSVTKRSASSRPR